MSRLRTLPWLIGIGACAMSCLPSDTRPVPGSVLVTVSASPSTTEGFVTADGWNVSFGKLLVSLGHVSLNGDSCGEYSDPSYWRIFDMRRDGQQKVSVAYGLGQCDFEFAISNPDSMAVLGEGVTERDKTFMRTRGIDGYADGNGISVYVEVSAEKNGTVKHLAWPFRRTVSYLACGEPSASTLVERGVDLRGNEAQAVNISIHGEALFRSALDDPGAPLRFAGIASADSEHGNDDGEISLAELALAPAPSAPTADAGAVSEGGLKVDAPEPYRADAREGERFATLADYVYLGLFPRMAQYREDGSCTAEVTIGPGEL